MFSNMSSTRFAKEREAKPGPGSYNLPAARDDKAPSMEGSQRWQDGSTELPGPGDYSVSPDRKNTEVLAHVASVLPQRPALRVLQENGNRTASVGSLRKSKGAAVGSLCSPRVRLSRGPNPQPAGVPALHSPRDAKLTAQLETMRVADQLRVAQQERTKAKRETIAVEEERDAISRQLLEVEAEHDAEHDAMHRHLLEVEADRNAMRLNLHEKDGELQSLQRMSVHKETKWKQQEKDREEEQAAIHQHFAVLEETAHRSEARRRECERRESENEEKLRDLQKWADDQQLRELSVECETVDRLKHVRQELSEQFSAAVVNDLQELQVKLAEKDKELKETAKALADAEAALAHAETAQKDLLTQLKQTKHELLEKEEQLRTLVKRINEAAEEDEGAKEVMPTESNETAE